MSTPTPAEAPKTVERRYTLLSERMTLFDKHKGPDGLIDLNLIKDYRERQNQQSWLDRAKGQWVLHRLNPAVARELNARHILDGTLGGSEKHLERKIRRKKRNLKTPPNAILPLEEEPIKPVAMDTTEKQKRSIVMDEDSNDKTVFPEEKKRPIEEEPADAPPAKKAKGPSAYEELMKSANAHRIESILIPTLDGTEDDDPAIKKIRDELKDAKKDNLFMKRGLDSSWHALKSQKSELDRAHIEIASLHSKLKTHSDLKAAQAQATEEIKRASDSIKEIRDLKSLLLRTVNLIAEKLSLPE